MASRIATDYRNNFRPAGPAGRVQAGQARIGTDERIGGLKFLISRSRKLLRAGLL